MPTKINQKIPFSDPTMTKPPFWVTKCPFDVTKWVFCNFKDEEK